MKSLGEVAYEAFALRYTQRYSATLCQWDRLNVASQLIWEATARDVRSAQGPFREVETDSPGVPS